MDHSSDTPICIDEQFVTVRHKPRKERATKVAPVRKPKTTVDEVMKACETVLPATNALGALVHGSTIDSAKPFNNDVDLMVFYKNGFQPDIEGLCVVRSALSEILGKEVDMVVMLHMGHFTDSIVKDAKYVSIVRERGVTVFTGKDKGDMRYLIDSSIKYKHIYNNNLEKIKS